MEKPQPHITWHESSPRPPFDKMSLNEPKLTMLEEQARRDAKEKTVRDGVPNHISAERFNELVIQHATGEQ